jgi:hypothetical protein
LELYLLLLVFVIEHSFIIRILAQSAILEVSRDKYEMNIVTGHRLNNLDKFRGFASGLNIGGCPPAKSAKLHVDEA